MYELRTAPYEMIITCAITIKLRAVSQYGHNLFHRLHVSLFTVNKFTSVLSAVDLLQSGAWATCIGRYK